MAGTMPRVHSAPNHSLASLVIDPDDYIYFRQMKNILDSHPNYGPPRESSQLTPYIFMGSLRNADDLAFLQDKGITHVLNCAGTRTFDLDRSPYPPSVGVTNFLMIPAEDHGEYNIMSHFPEAFLFLDNCRRSGGKALIHCNLGINRSGAIAASYIMVSEHRPLLEVVTLLKKARGLVLCNKGFRRQLIRFARIRGYLDIPQYLPQSESIKFGTDKTNIISLTQCFQGNNANKSASTDAIHMYSTNENSHTLANGYPYNSNTYHSGSTLPTSDKYKHGYGRSRETILSDSSAYTNNFTTTNGTSREKNFSNDSRYLSSSSNFSLNGAAKSLTGDHHSDNYSAASITNNKRPVAASHYESAYYMDTIPEDSRHNPRKPRESSAPPLRNYSTSASKTSSNRSLSSFGEKAMAQFKKSKTRSISVDTPRKMSDNREDGKVSCGLSTTRPLRVYKRSVTDTEIYQKPSSSHAVYKRADTIATSDLASGLERLTLSSKTTSMPSGLSQRHRVSSRLSLSSSIFNRIKSDWKKS